MQYPDGNFEYTFTNYQDVLLSEGINRVHVEVECGGLTSDRFTSFSKGNASFEYEEKEQVEIVEQEPVDETKAV